MPPVERVHVGPGAGLVIGLVGLVTMTVAVLVPWEGYYADFALLMVPFTIAWWSFAVFCTTMRYQPGGFAGFLLAGFIGLILLRERADASSRRGNFVAALAGIALILRGFFAPSDGAGPVVMLVGQLITLVGILVGRRVTRTVTVPGA